MTARCLTLIAPMCLAGCIAAGPDYKPPPTGAPQAWASLQPQGEPALTPDQATDLASWWKWLDDPLLGECVETALRANPDVASAQARLRQVRAQRVVAAAGLYPSLDASGNARRTNASAESSGRDATIDNYGAGLDASWEIDVFGGTRRGLEAATADVQASAASLAATQVSLAAEVASNYVDVRLQQALIRIARDNAASQFETLQLTEWRAQAGLASAQDVEQARTNLERTRALIPAIETSLAQSEHRLDTLLALTPGTLHERLVAPAPPLVVPQRIAVGIPAATLRQRPDVQAAERNLAAETARVGQAEAALYPSFNLSGSIGVEALSLGNLGNGNAGYWSLLAGITAPLFEGGRLRAQVEAQDAVREQALAAYRKTVLTALEEVENALVALSKNHERELSLNTAVDSARTADTLARERYTAGLIDFQSVLDTDRTVLAVEESLAQNRADGVQALVGLYRSLGGGWSPGTVATPAGNAKP
jgi:NodT family efflux transporter outer membrane factor (OMF) lipoprotein